MSLTVLRDIHSAHSTAARLLVASRKWGWNQPAATTRWLIQAVLRERMMPPGVPADGGPAMSVVCALLAFAERTPRRDVRDFARLVIFAVEAGILEPVPAEGTERIFLRARNDGGVPIFVQGFVVWPCGCVLTLGAENYANADELIEAHQ